MQPDFFERHAGKIDRSGECWVWTAQRDDDGYGRVQIGKTPRRPHRVAYEIAYGAIPAGALVLHRCDNPSCVRPDHLFLGTHADNVRDRDAKGRTARGSRQGGAILDEARVARMRSLRRSGVSARRLATSFGVSEPTVYAVLSRRMWRHVP